jgi:hypothetical protein
VSERQFCRDERACVITAGINRAVRFGPPAGSNEHVGHDVGVRRNVEVAIGSI